MTTCPKCHSEKVDQGGTAYAADSRCFCLSCNTAWTDWQQQRIAELEAELAKYRLTWQTACDYIEKQAWHHHGNMDVLAIAKQFRKLAASLLKESE